MVLTILTATRNRAMSRIEGCGYGINEEECDAKSEKIAALNPSPMTPPIGVTLELHMGMQGFGQWTDVPRWDAECVDAIHENASLTPNELRGRWVGCDELRIEGYAE